jgi:hypothetical protein
VTGGFNLQVPQLCDGIEFDLEGKGQGAHYCISSLISGGVLQERGLRLHMAQAPFVQQDWPVPALPITLPLITAPCGLTFWSSPSSATRPSQIPCTTVLSPAIITKFQ